jgi:hypothetical protein
MLVALVLCLQAEKRKGVGRSLTQWFSRSGKSHESAPNSRPMSPNPLANGGSH